MFERTDPWVFLSLYLTAKHGPFDLSSLIEAADHIEVAVPTRIEVEGAINRFIRAGLIDLHDGTPALTAAGAALGDRASSQAQFIRDILPHVSSLLGSVAPRPATQDQPTWHTTDEAFGTAFRAYEQRASEFMEALRKKSNAPHE